MSDTPIFDSVGNAPEPDKSPQPKVVAATVGAGSGAAVVVILTWIVETLASIDIPSSVEGAAVILITSALAFVGGYWKRND